MLTGCEHVSIMNTVNPLCRMLSIHARTFIVAGFDYRIPSHTEPSMYKLVTQVDHKDTQRLLEHDLTRLSGLTILVVLTQKRLTSYKLYIETFKKAM